MKLAALIEVGNVKQLAMALLGLAFLMAGVGHTQAAPIYSNDFDGGESFASGVSGGFSGITTTESVQNYSGYGNGANMFSGDFLRNDSPDRPNITPHQGVAPDPPSPTVLTLNNLPIHTSVNVGFLLAIIDSWDGSGPAGNTNNTPDIFNVAVDSVIVFSEGIDETETGDSYTPPVGGLLVLSQQLGFTTGPGVGFFDSAYDMTLEPSLLNIPHTASSITIEWFASGAGWEGGISESWAIENVEVELNVVPEPSSLALLCIGVIGLFGYGWRKRKAA